MKSSVAITAGCLLAAFGVGDTVNQVVARIMTRHAVVASKGGMGDVSKLTGQEDESADKNLDELFAGKDGKKTDGIDADELSSIRELARVAVPQQSDWGSEFYKTSDGSVGGVSSSALASTTGAWDTTLGTKVATATSGPMSYIASGSTGGSGIADEFALADDASATGVAYGGDAGGGVSASARAKAAVLLSTVSQTASVPEPASIAGIALAGGFLLKRRRRLA